MFVFGEDEEVPHDKIKFLLTRIDEISGILQREGGSQATMLRRETLVGWKPPPMGWMILNMHGAAKGNPGLVGSGGVLRGSRGEWQWGFAEHAGCCSSMKAELKAVLRGLTIARQRSISKLWVQSDSVVLVGLL